MEGSHRVIAPGMSACVYWLDSPVHGGDDCVASGRERGEVRVVLARRMPDRAFRPRRPGQPGAALSGVERGPRERAPQRGRVRAYIASACRGGRRHRCGAVTRCGRSRGSGTSMVGVGGPLGFLVDESEDSIRAAGPTSAACALEVRVPGGGRRSRPPSTALGAGVVTVIFPVARIRRVMRSAPSPAGA